jgi:energy-coupling factor transporter transmembrane protein EcfT
MGLKGRKGLIAALLLVLAAVLIPLEYAPAALFLLLLWAFFHRVSIVSALAAAAFFSISIGISAVVLGMGPVHGVLVSFRALSLLLPVYVYFSSSSMQEVMEALESFGVPKDFSFMLSISIPYAHVLGRKAAQVRIAQKSRGSRSPWAVLMPLLNFVFERAHMLAISIESRGWSPSGD